MRLKRLDRGFALEAGGVDLARPLSDSAFREIEKAFFAGQVLVFRGQKLSAPQFLGFARRLGQPEPHVVDQFHHPEHSDILILSNVVRDGRPTGLADAGTYFHRACPKPRHAGCSTSSSVTPRSTNTDTA